MSHSWCSLFHLCPELLFLSTKHVNLDRRKATSPPPKQCPEAPRHRALRASGTIPQQEEGLHHSAALRSPHPERRTWRRNRSRGELLIRAVNSWTLCWYYFAHNGHAGRSHQLGWRSEGGVTAKDDTGLPAVKVCVLVSLCEFLYNWSLVWVSVSVYGVCLCVCTSVFLTEAGGCEQRVGLHADVGAKNKCPTCSYPPFQMWNCGQQELKFTEAHWYSIILYVFHLLHRHLSESLWYKFNGTCNPLN